MTNSELSLIAVVIVMVLLFGIWWLWWRLPKWQVSRLALKIRDPKARADVEDNFRKTVGQASLGVHRRSRPRWFASGWCRHEASGEPVPVCRDRGLAGEEHYFSKRFGECLSTLAEVYGFSNGEKKNRAPSLHLLPDRAAAELDRLLGE